MRYPIKKGWTIDKNELPELVGLASRMWVLAPIDAPNEFLFCYPECLKGPVPVGITIHLGYKPEDCFWRIARVMVTATQETAVNDADEYHEAWQIKNGEYLIVKET